MFDLIFLGTAACDFSPLLKTECKDRFDNNARRASSMLVNGSCLIDAGDHIIDSLRIAEVPLDNITDIFITHIHSDHFNPENIARIAEAKSDSLRLWVGDKAMIPQIPNTEVIRTEDYQTITTDTGISVTGLTANHDPAACPRYLFLEKDGKKLLYATDGGWFLNKTYFFLQNKGLDLMAIDATCGDYVGDFRMAEHNSIPMIRLMMPSLRTIGALKENSRVFLTHIAPSLHKSHEETVKIVAPDGLEVAFDGLKLTI